MERLYLFRHGMTECNERRAYCGSTDVPLSLRGRLLLQQKKQSFRYPDISGCRIVTSGMQRTEETLSLLYGALPHSIDKRLREIDFGAFEGYTHGELEHRPDYRRWIAGAGMEVPCPGGESGSGMVQRVLAALQELRAMPEAGLALFTHGGPVAAIMQELFPAEAKNRYEWQPDFACGYEVRFEEGKPSYRCIPEPLSQEVC